MILLVLISPLRSEAVRGMRKSEMLDIETDNTTKYKQSYLAVLNDKLLNLCLSHANMVTQKSRARVFSYERIITCVLSGNSKEKTMAKTTKIKEEFTVETVSDVDIDAAIVSFGVLATTVKHRLHSLLVSTCVVYHDEGFAGRKDNDAVIEAAKKACDRINALMVSSSYHSRAVSVWVGMMLPFTWSEENKKWYVNTNDELILKGKSLEKLRDNPFWDVSPPSVPKPYIMGDDIALVIARVEKSSKAPKDGDVIELSALKFLREALKAVQEAEEVRTKLQKIEDRRASKEEEPAH